ncbi:MAG: GNAT family N-acetyltransferase [Termitinemataceae bacterium]|nr:MAG: GNAT family N-acetyltransferase [Termitinemataceae bacterium]
MMEYKITAISENAKKTEYTNTIMHNLSDWFDDWDFNEYIPNVHKYPYWAAFDNNRCVGFLSAKIHYDKTGEIYVCGVDQKYHAKGIGTLLYNEGEKYFLKNNCRYIVLKTISEVDIDEYYISTRRFYKKMGFDELITLNEMWNDECHCLLMIKKL